MDLVKIGFEIQAKGIKDANTEADKLLTKLEQLEKRKPVKVPVQDTTTRRSPSVEIDKTTKALEKQQIIGEYLEKGMSRSTASAVANFKLLGAELNATNGYFSKLSSNAGLVSANKQAKSVTETLDKMRINAELAGKGYSAAEQAQLRSLQLGGASNQQMQQAIELLKKKRQEDILSDYRKQKGSLQADWLKAYDDEAKYRIAKQQEVANKTKAIQDVVAGYESKSHQSFGNGVIDQANANNKILADMRDHYKKLESLDAAHAEKRRVTEMKARQTEYQETLAMVEKQRVTEMKARQAEYLKSPAVNPPASANTSTWKNVGETNGLKAFADQSLKAQQAYGGLLSTIGNIAKYAILSAAIYGVMNAFSAAIGAMVTMADEYTSIQNRLKLYVKSSEELASVNAFAAKASIQNNVGLRETTTLYARLAPAMKSIGANTAATKTVVDAFGKSMRIGGATLREAEAATIQFSQAMASGKLAGDEFRSISEASPRFLKAIADGSGIAANKLKDMSAAGMLTTEVISRALVKEYAKLAKESESLGYSLEQGTNALKVGFMALIGEFNEGAGITQFLGAKLAGLGVAMIDGVKGAKAAGAEFKAWIISVKEEISTAFEVMKFAAIAFSSFMLGKFVVSIAAAAGSAISGFMAMYVASKAYFTAISMEAGKAAASVTVLGNVAKSVGTGLLGLFGGGILGAVGLVATVLGIAGSYLLMKDNAKEATKELALQGTAASKTKEELLALKGAQLANEKNDLAAEFKIQNEELAHYNTLIGNSIAKISSQNTANAEAATILKNVRTGAMSYKDALEKLNTMKGVSPAAIKELQDLIKKYEETRVIASKNAEQQGILGNSVTLMGNKVQNQLPLLGDFKNAITGIGEEASITGSKLGKMYEDFKTATVEKETQYLLMTRYKKMSPESAAKLAKTGLARITADKTRKTGLYQSEVDAALAYDEANDRVNGLSKQDKKAESAREKARKERERALANYNEQIAVVQRLQNLLAQGESYEVAKVAAEKEYTKHIKGTAIAKEIVEAQNLATMMEYVNGLGKEEELQSRIIGLMKKGAAYEVAREVASANFGGSLKGQEMAAFAMTNALGSQNQKLVDQVNTQQTINDLLGQGLSLEEATLQATMLRLKKLQGGTLTKVQTSLQDNISKDARALEIAKATANIRLSITESTRQAAVYQGELTRSATQYSLALAKIKADNKDISDKDAKDKLKADQELSFVQQKASIQTELNGLLSGEDELMRSISAAYPAIEEADRARMYHNQKLVSFLEEQAALKEDMKKNPLGDFSSVSFEAFGDMGNPFQSAIEGANQFMASMTHLDEGLARFREEQKNLNEERNNEEVGTAAYDELTKKMQQYAKDEKLNIKQARDAKIEFAGTAISGVKSLFKEESKAYKVVSGLEKAYQAGVIAFKLWEKREEIQAMAIKLMGYAKEGAAFVANAAVKIAAQMGVNLAKGTEAVLTQGSGDPYTAFPRMAAMAAIVAGLGIAISGGFSGGDSGSYDSYDNTGTGTVFGGAADDTSKSIQKAVEILADNSDLGLPISAAMLRSVQNIESAIGGVANLLIRGDVGASVAEGKSYDAKLTGIVGSVAKFEDKIFKFIAGDWLTGFGIGEMLSGVFSSLLGGLFGKTSSEVTAQGLIGSRQSLGSVVTNGANLSEYADVKTTKKSWFSKSTDYSTAYGAADQELKNQFTLVFSNIYDSVLSASDALGRDLTKVSDNLNKYIVDIGKINIKGLNGKEIQEKLEAVFGAEADKIAKNAVGGLDAFQKIGEGYYETLVRVAAGIEEAQFYADRLNVTAIQYADIVYKQGNVAAELLRQSILAAEGSKRVAGGFYDLVNTFSGTAGEIADFVVTLRDLQDAIFATGKSGDYLTSTMILGAGGLGTLTDGLEAYFEMLSPAEQAAELTRRLANEFALVGKELPSGIKGFRDLVSGIDISTVAGQKLYGQVIALAPEFNDLQDALDKANSEVNSLVKSLRDLAEEARKARGETQQPRNLAAIRAEFDSQSALAMQGDTTAANKLLTLGKDLMQVSKQYSVTGSEYARDLAVVQRAATVSADVQELGLGYSNPSLTPLAGSTTSPTVTTVNSSTDAKLEALRADLVTAITAVAKYTQDTAQRLQRWDYGDKMNVHVEQEVGDAPIKVKTV